MKLKNTTGCDSRRNLEKNFQSPKLFGKTITYFFTKLNYEYLYAKIEDISLSCGK